MKRSGFKSRAALLSRGKPMARGSKPLKRTKRMRPRSEKRARIYKTIRVPFVERVLRERPKCEAGPMLVTLDPSWRCWRTSTNVHEILPRGRGGRIDDLADDEVVSCCDVCGGAVHQSHWTEAYALGLVNESHEGPRPRAPIVEWRRAHGIVLAGRAQHDGSGA